MELTSSRIFDILGFNDDVTFRDGMNPICYVTDVLPFDLHYITFAMVNRRKKSIFYTFNFKFLQSVCFCVFQISSSLLILLGSHFFNFYLGMGTLRNEKFVIQCHAAKYFFLG